MESAAREVNRLVWRNAILGVSPSPEEPGPFLRDVAQRLDMNQASATDLAREILCKAYGFEGSESMRRAIGRGKRSQNPLRAYLREDVG